MSARLFWADGRLYLGFCARNGASARFSTREREKEDLRLCNLSIKTAYFA
jgi:hypothetical protein